MRLEGKSGELTVLMQLVAFAGARNRGPSNVTRLPLVNVLSHWSSDLYWMTAGLNLLVHGDTTWNGEG